MAKDDIKDAAAKFARTLLSGAVESIARAGAKAVESIADDAQKAVQGEADKIAAIKDGVRIWRHFRLGDDLPSELQDDEEKVKG